MTNSRRADVPPPDPDELESFVRDEVLYRSFEDRGVDYHIDADIERYPRQIVTPKRLEENIWATISDGWCGSTIHAGSYVHDTYTDQHVTVLYRATARLSYDAVDIDATVIVAPSDRTQSETFK